MDLEYFILGGYGLFVWPAFIFTFISCFYLYLKSIKELKKQEGIFFNEFDGPRKRKFYVNCFCA